MRRWNGSSFVSVLACHLVGAKLLSEPVITSLQSHPVERLQRKTIETNQCPLPNLYFNLSSVIFPPLCSGEISYWKVIEVTDFEISIYIRIVAMMQHEVIEHEMDQLHVKIQNVLLPIIVQNWSHKMCKLVLPFFDWTILRYYWQAAYTIR